MERRFSRKRTLRGLALDQFHHQIIGSDVKQSADIWMIQRGDRANLAFEALAEPIGAHFDGDFPSRTGIVSTIHLPHAAGREKRTNFVRPQMFARLELS